MNSDYPGTPGENPSTGARCITHPDNLAGGTCSRCGNFLCYIDTEGGRFTTCETCRARAGMGGAFPLTRENYDFGALWSYSWELFKQHWLMLSVGVLIPLLAYAVMYTVMYVFILGTSFATGSMGGDFGSAAAVGTVIMTFGFTLLIVVVLGMLLVGFFRMCHDVLDGGMPDIGRMFSVFNKVGRGLLIWVGFFFASYLLAFLCFGPAIGVGFLMRDSNEAATFVAAGTLGLGGFILYMFVLLPFYLLPQEMAYSDAGVLQLIVNCWKMTSGFRWSIVLVMLVFLGLYIGGFFACCIGVIPALALSGLLFTGLHRGLRAGAEGVSQT